MLKYIFMTSMLFFSSISADYPNDEHGDGIVDPDFYVHDMRIKITRYIENQLIVVRLNITYAESWNEYYFQWGKYNAYNDIFNFLVELD